MPVALQVSEVCRGLYERGGREAVGDGHRSTALLGTLFHEIFTGLVDANSNQNCAAALADEEPNEAVWRAVLREHTYVQLVGPRLRRHQAVLQSQAEEVCAFWEAVQHLTDWIVTLLWTYWEAEKRLPDPASLVVAGKELHLELREPAWRDSVHLNGVADAVWQIPGTRSWCVTELKLGQSHEEVDLAQVCLYQMMLEKLNGFAPPDGGTLALVSFKPAKCERLIQPDQLHPVHKELVDFIGQLAGVTPLRVEHWWEKFPRWPLSKGSKPEAAKPRPAAPPAPDASHEQLGRELLGVLSEFDARAELDGPPSVGPTFVRFRLKPSPKVRVQKFNALSGDLQVRLGLQAAPFVSVIGGHVVVDIQRPDREVVHFSSIVAQLPAADALHGSAKVLLGVDLDGKAQFADLANPENCHFLVAGTTGSGKTAWLRTAIRSLILANSPETLQLLLIDPKGNAFTELSGSPFLRQPIVAHNDASSAAVLRGLADEMDLRYQALGDAESLAEYATRLRRPVPRIVCVCDEYYDLISRSKQDRAAIEQQIFRLGAKARAAGIHLVIATQRPSRDIVKGALDVNIPARVALMMSSPIESRMLLGQSGAEQLLGRGDLLFKDIGEPRRLQGALLANGR